MIIDITQTNDSVIVSYVAEDGSITLKQFNVFDIVGGFYEYAVCGENDPEKIEGLRGYMDNEPVRRKESFRFNTTTLREFLTQKIPEADQKEIFAFRLPTMYACDIEIDLASDEAEIFPDPQQALFEICTIQITAPNYNTIVLTKDKDRVKPGDEVIIQDKLKEHFKDSIVKDKDLRFAFVLFENEKELLEYWFKILNESIHSTIWWNSWNFDLPYIENRCKKHGIDMKAGSPTGEYKQQKMYPKHRLTVDYFDATKKYGWELYPINSWALGNVAKKLFGVTKVPFEGSFKEMYLGDYRDFNFYGAVDTILLQMIHTDRGYYTTILSLGYFGKIGAYDAWATTKVSEAVIFDSLYLDNLINPYPFEKKVKTKFEGGYVKAPVRKFASYPVCYDFASLYPNIYRSTNVSFENFIKLAKTKEEAMQARAAGHFVSVDGNIYKNDKDYTMRRVQTELYEKRKAYKALTFDLYQEVETEIAAEMKKRNLTPDYHK